MRSSNRVYETLRERIVAGHYGPGEQIKEEPLARELGVSRTPVRAALRRLIGDGLATADAGQGVRVPVWGDADIEETFHLRILLEPYAACLAAQRGGEAMVSRLRRFNADMASGIRARDVEKVQLANQSFHRTLLQNCGSPRLRSILETMADIPILVRSFYLSDKQELLQSLRHHEELTLAAAERDGETARKAMELHLHTSFRRFIRRRSEYRGQGPTGKGKGAAAGDATGSP